MRAASSDSSRSASFFTLYSPRICFTSSSRVRDDLDFLHLQLGRPLEAGDEASVLGDVVRRDADRLAVRGERLPSSVSST